MARRRSAGEATALWQSAVAHSPFSSGARLQLARSYAAAGKLHDADKEVRTALELSPDYAGGSKYWLGRVLLLKGDAQGALEAFKNEPLAAWRLWGLPMAYHALNRTAESEAALRELIELIDKSPDGAAWMIGSVYAYRGQADEAFAWLERGYVKRPNYFAYSFKTDPLLAPIRADPRYAARRDRLRGSAGSAETVRGTRAPLTAAALSAGITHGRAGAPVRNHKPLEKLRKAFLVRGLLHGTGESKR